MMPDAVAAALTRGLNGDPRWQVILDSARDAGLADNPAIS
jgi:hypothetical protein